VRRALLIVAVLAVAGTCGFLAYDALAGSPAPRDPWAQAAASARKADMTKAKLTAALIRDRAISTFQRLAASGLPANRSRAELVTALLEIRNTDAEPNLSRRLQVEAAGALQRAIRLDAANDDAAYDLELLLSRAKQQGRPILQTSRQARRHGPTTPGAGKPGTGY
jgi:hypothetical protein